MLLKCENFHCTYLFNLLIFISYSIYKVNDSSKDKKFLLELSWVGAHTNGKHVILGTDDPVYIKAKEYAKNAAEENDESDTEIA